MSSVLEGGAGELKPGIEDRSIDKGDLDRFFDSEPGEDVADTGGETWSPLVCIGGSWTATDMSAVGVVVDVFCSCVTCDVSGLIPSKPVEEESMLGVVHIYCNSKQSDVALVRWWSDTATRRS